MKFLTIYVRIFCSTIMMSLIILSGLYVHPYIKQSCSLSTYHIEQKPIKTSLGLCEKCNKPLRVVHGKFGEFIGCSGYPECTYIKRKKASFSCPKCFGKIEEKKWQKGTLWGCSNYPVCRYAIFSDIQDTPCPVCNKTLYMLKKIDDQGATSLICPNEECKHTMII